MPQINLGTVANDGTGSPLRTGGLLINQYGLLGDKTVNAAFYKTASITNEAAITLAIVAAALLGTGAAVWVPASMLPYNASLVTFNPAVRMLREGGPVELWDVMAYGAAGNIVQDDGAAIRAAIAGANLFPSNLTGNVVYFPAGRYLYTGTIQVPVALNQGQVILRGAGMRSTYLFPSGASTTFTAAPLYNVCLLFGSATPDAAGTSTNVTQYCGMEDMSINGTFISSGSVVAVQFTEMQYGWMRNHITENFPNNSIGCYLRGSTVTGGLGTLTSFPHTRMCNFINCTIQTIGGSNLGGTPLLLQNADENNFYSCSCQPTTGQTVAANSIFATSIQMGRNNRFFGCLMAGDTGATKTGYVGMVFGPPVNEAGVANGSVLQNQDYGFVAEGFSICIWFRADSSGNTLGNGSNGGQPSVYTTAYKDDTAPIANGGFVGGGQGGNYFISPLINVNYIASGRPAAPTCLFPINSATPSIGGSDVWGTQNNAGTIITTFNAPTDGSVDGRTITLRINDANTTIRDVNNGGGGNIRCLGRQDIVGAVGLVVSFVAVAGIWYQQTIPVAASNLGGAAVLRMQVSLALKLVVPTEAVLVSGVGIDGGIGNIFQVTLTAARVVGAPLQPITGQRITFTFIQGGAGAWAVTWNAVFKKTWVDTGNATGARSSISYIYDGTNWNQDGAQAPYV